VEANKEVLLMVIKWGKQLSYCDAPRSWPLWHYGLPHDFLLVEHNGLAPLLTVRRPSIPGCGLRLYPPAHTHCACAPVHRQRR